MGPGLGELVRNIVLENKEIPEFFNIKRLESNNKSSQYYNSQIKYNKKKRLFN